MTTRSAHRRTDKLPGKHNRPGKDRPARPRSKSVESSAGHSPTKPVENAASPAVTVALAIDLDEELSWSTKLVDRLRSMAATGYGVSIAVHLLLLVVLSLIVIRIRTPEEPSITSVFVVHEVIDFQELEPITLEPLDSRQPFNPANVLASTQPDLVDSILNAASPGETEATETIGQSAGFQMPGGGRAVTKGSFTAWTVPEDPAPREDYLVVIQIRVPEKLRTYRKEDLSGFLKGDDGYETPLGNFTGRGFPKQYYGKFDDQTDQFVIRIPGGAAKVQDIIQIHSKVLREKQTLEITF